jgi:hypothetical protein
VLGEVATGVLRAHGLLWPANIHLHVPALERARGGSLLVAEDARGLTDGWPFGRVQAVLHGRTRPQPRDVLRVAAALAPVRLRRRAYAARVRAHFPWLRPAGARRVAARAEVPDVPRRWDRQVAWHARRRAVRLPALSLDAMARTYEVSACRPLLSPVFLAALAREGGATGLGDRDEVARRLLGDLIPDPVLRRKPTRTELGSVLWATRSREFARAWNGDGVDQALVDAERLRAIWLGERPWLHASTLAQAAWLAGPGAV